MRKAIARQSAEQIVQRVMTFRPKTGDGAGAHRARAQGEFKKEMEKLVQHGSPGAD